MSSTTEPLCEKSISTKCGKDLIEKFTAINLSDKEITNKRCDRKCIENKNSRETTKGMSPAEFVNLQSLRSRSLADKIQTTSANGHSDRTLFADLRGGTTNIIGSKKSGFCEGDKEEEKTTEYSVKNEKENTVLGLLARGPIRTERATYPSHHPYDQMKYPGIVDEERYRSFSLICDTKPNKEKPGELIVGLPSKSSTPDTIRSDLGYNSESPYFPAAKSDEDLARKSELPDDLSDFILNYSTKYFANSFESTDLNSNKQDLFDTSNCGRFHPNTPKNLTERRDAAFLGPSSSRNYLCGSIAFDETGCSGEHSFSLYSNPEDVFATPLQERQKAITVSPTATREQKMRSKQVRTAKNRLKSLISEYEMSEAWAWACKCVKQFPGGLAYKDSDGDTLLHIVILHLDIPKIYAIVEHMLKTDFLKEERPYDIPNKHNETPLFLAVAKRNLHVVDYLLEVGADPNIRNQRSEQDSPLHYAAARGMKQLVKRLCEVDKIELNCINGIGLTPLLCAVSNHLSLEEETQDLVDNSDTVSILLRNGADPFTCDAMTGKNILHLLMDRVDNNLIKIIKMDIEPNVLRKLLEMPNFDQRTPVELMKMINPQILTDILSICESDHVLSSNFINFS